ncbi:OmpA family protein [Ravibacter arvi]|uniref:OmpA family protein n=1 Tax=Ravibacter arvi TaxID=2051041 RepID=UPI0031EE9238
MKKVSRLFLSILLGAAGISSSLAQEIAQPNSPDYNPKALYEGPYKLNTWSVSAHFGPGQYYGDLREYDFFPVTKSNIDSHSEVSVQGGITLHKQLSYLFGAKADLSFGGLNGMKRRLYNSYFTGSYTDFSISGTVNLKGLLMGANKMKRWKIDLSLGAGQVWYNSKAYRLGTGELLRSTEGTRNDWIIPLGMTFNYELSPRFDIGLDFRANRVNSDYLDATYGGADPSEAANATTSRKGTSAVDVYGGASVVLTYKFGKKPLRVKKENGKWAYHPEDGNGYYNLRYTDPKVLVKPPKILTLEEMDSVAKANRPEDIDPRLLLDSDGDGVSDFFDKEPNSPAGSIVDGSGRVIDFDAYVKNALSTQLGCTEVFANIQFKTDKSLLDDEGKEILRNVAQVMNKNGCRLQLAGHADRRASDRYNLGLSKRRVEAVKDFLIKEAGVNAGKIMVDYFGSFKPIADGSSREGLQKNRRVELRLLP